MLPQPKTKFLPISELDNYKDSDKYFCSAVVFSPETENNHFHNCPPYITICEVDDIMAEEIYFEIPKIVAYYAKTHSCYTMEGMKRQREQGERDFKIKLKQLLEP